MICLRLLLHTVFFAEYFACDNAGNSSAARMAMMAMTTNSSIKVKAFAQRAFFLWELDFTEYREPYSKAVISSTPEFAGPPAAACVLRLANVTSFAREPKHENVRAKDVCDVDGTEERSMPYRRSFGLLLVQAPNGTCS